LYTCGDCILIETNQYEDGRPKAHLFVVILDTKHDEDTTILIPMDTIPQRGFYDPTTLLQAGDHDFVILPTYMNYYEGRIRTQKWIDANHKGRLPKIRQDIFRRICDGIAASDHTLNDVYDAYLFRKR
jgi:hypothetical protein